LAFFFSFSKIFTKLAKLVETIQAMVLNSSLALLLLSEQDSETVFRVAFNLGSFFNFSRSSFFWKGRKEISLDQRNILSRKRKEKKRKENLENRKTLSQSKWPFE